MFFVYLILCYLIGSIMFGYLVIKALYHGDIRVNGSGNVGARNAGRLYGKKAFIMIFLGDALKGAVVILLARFLQYSETIQLLGLGLAVLGHIKPVTLQFQGGKGISTFIGGIMVFEPYLIPVVILGFLILYPFTKSFTFSGLGAFLLIPLFLSLWHYHWLTCVLVSCIIALILLVHSENIKARLNR